jgi:hypothetical protein
VRREEDVMRIARPSSFTGLAKVIIYLAFGASLLVTLNTVGSFIYMMANAGDLSRVNATNMYEMSALAEEISPDTWGSESGEVSFRLHKLYGELSYLNMPRALVLAVFFRELVLCGLFFIGVVQLANMFEDLSRGKPFVRENAARLRIVGYAMAGGALFKVLVQTGTFLLFRGEIYIKGTETPWLFLLKETFNGGLLAGGIVVLVISEVFRIGTRLQEEQELTV